jgi:GTP-binding protein Era
MNDTKCIFVAVVGEPNAGKSTLINSIVGTKISIVSHKIQTTRRQVKGIIQINETQIVFTDTPGFCKSNSSLEKVIQSNFKYSYKDSDLILLLIDPNSKKLPMTFNFIEKININKNLIIVINKVDISKKENILKTTAQLSKYEFITKVFMVSALTKDGLDDLIKFLTECAPISPWMFEKGQITDVDLKFRLSEITREKIFKYLEKELPYSVYIETEDIRENDKKIILYQSIVVLKNSQKGIVLGNKGAMIKTIREEAARDIHKILHKRIEMRLFVKVREGWTENKRYLQDAGIIDH